jgi:hypothetical protein
LGLPQAPLAGRVSGKSASGSWELLVPVSFSEPLVLRDDSGQAQTSWVDWREGKETLARCEELLSQRGPGSNALWLAACRSLEAVAAVEKSLQRGRTIELNQAEQTEEHAFKGVMASAGCLLLLLMLVAVFVVSLVEGLQLPLRKSLIWRAWPLALVLPLGIFLAMQFLQTIIEKPAREERTESS